MDIGAGSLLAVAGDAGTGAVKLLAKILADLALSVKAELSKIALSQVLRAARERATLWLKWQFSENAPCDCQP
jgi:hypothetical protein